jgi:serine/threonine-protein kinase
VTNLVSGTPFYMAPEQACGHVTDGRADIYSAGVVLWEILAGKLPTKSQEVNDIMNIKIYTPELFFTSLPSHSSASIDCDFEMILLKAVAGKPNDRYQSCSSFAKDLISYYEKKFKVTFHG